MFETTITLYGIDSPTRYPKSNGKYGKKRKHLVYAHYVATVPVGYN